jgi:hypothetical protein
MAKTARSVQVATIKRDLVKAGHDPEAVDVDALVDGTLTIGENRKNVAAKLRYKLGKKPGVRESKRRADVGACESLRHQCEIKGDTQSCRDYGRSKCSSVTGKIEGCRVCNVSRSTAAGGRKKKEKKTNAVLRDGQCMIPVKSYLRRCSPKTAANMRAARGR